MGTIPSLDPTVQDVLTTQINVLKNGWNPAEPTSYHRHTAGDVASNIDAIIDRV